MQITKPTPLQQIKFPVSIKFFLLASLLAFGFFAKGQTWESLNYDPNKNGLEANPLKGFSTMFNPSSSIQHIFPHSIRGKLFGLDTVMQGLHTFSWAPIDSFVAQQAREGRHSYIQVNIDPVNGTSNMPNFLVNQVEWYWQVPIPGTQLKDGDSCPNWNNTHLMTAMLNFIDSFGRRYDNDPRVFLVHLGLYGLWGEWHIGPEITNARPAFDMTEQNKSFIANAYKNAFPNKYLLARYPEHMPDPQIYGYSDGLFFGQSISATNASFFHNTLKTYRADKNWKLYPIGGEIDPAYQPTIFDNLTTPPGSAQNVFDCLDSIHPTWLFWHHVFELGVLNNTEWNNAIQVQKAMGYTFYVDKYRVSATGGKPTIEFNIQNKGIAPIYANWNVEFGVLNSSNQFQSLGFKKMNLNLMQPGELDNYRSFYSETVLPNDTYTFMMRVMNPLEVYSTQASILRFANTTQDADSTGWITFGTKSITAGSAGSVPTKVTGITLTPATAQITVGQTLPLTTQVLPGNATSPNITYVSSHPTTASVDANGLLTAGPNYGPVTISAYTQDGGFLAQSTINVEPIRIPIPALIQAEKYIRMSGIVVEGPAGGNQNLGFIDNNEWMDYGVAVNANSNFSVDFRVSSQNGGGEISLLNQNGDTLGTVVIPSTTAWFIYDTVTLPSINLPAGNHNLRVFARRGGFNIDWLEFKTETTLPVQLLDINATAKINTISLEWATSSETDNAGFYIERSTGNNIFTKIGWVAGKGNSAILQQYGFIDSAVAKNRDYYYRIVQLNKNNSYTYSKIVRAKINSSSIDFSKQIHIYPNPASDKVEINWGTIRLNNLPINIELFNDCGANITPAIKNNRELTIAHLPAGVYFLVITIDGNKITKKVIKN